MPSPLSVPLRQRIAELLNQGLAPDDIATQLQISPRSVRRLRSRIRQRPADIALQTDYHAGGRRRCPAREALRQRCAQLRRLHPTWGSGRIRVELLRESFQNVPSRRILARWLKELGLAQSPTVADKPKTDDRRASQPQHTWQVDAKERMRLANGREVCWLRLVDECSGAVLLTVIFDFPHWADVEIQQVKDVLRRAFVRWGKPLRIRADNGHPWGTTGNLPTCIALWLAGMDIEVVNIPPRRPQKNGVVERSQGTGARWSEPWSCQNATDLQRRVDEEDKIQRQEYITDGGVSRLQAFPELMHSGRVYAVSVEEWLWDLDAALGYLSRWEVRRRVGKKGQVSVADRTYTIGVGYCGEVVRVRLDAATVEWVMRKEEGEEVGRVAARGLSREEILGYNVNRPKRRRQNGGPTFCPTPVQGPSGSQHPPPPPSAD